MPEYPLIQKYQDYWGLASHGDLPPSAGARQRLQTALREIDADPLCGFDWLFLSARLSRPLATLHACRVRGLGWFAHLLLTFEHSQTREPKTLCVAKIPLPVPESGAFLLASDSGALVERRPVTQIRVRPEWQGRDNRLKELVDTVGLHPGWCMTVDLVDRLDARLGASLHQVRRILGVSPRASGTGCQLLVLGRAWDVAVQAVFRDQRLLPLADTTNHLAAASQADSASLAGARVHKPFLLGSRLKDQVRYVQPVQRHVFCPVETPESKSIGLSLHFATRRDLRAWAPDADQAMEDQTEPACLDDLHPEGFLGHGANLIPFLRHTDPTRAMMGAKNMKQAVPVVGAEPPITGTGHESRVYPPGGDPGLNALVGYLPWYGYNYEDGIVVSRSLARRLASRRIHVLGPYFCKGHELGAKPGAEYPLLNDTGVISEGCDVAPGDVLAAWRPLRWENQGTDKAPRWRVIAMDPPRLERVPVGVHGTVSTVEHHVWKHSPRPFSWLENRARLTVHVQETMPLAVGDKIMGRHGNKGVVSLISPDREMPYFLDPVHGRRDHPGDREYHGEDRPHTHLEMLLNPLGVIGRMNFGQLLEAHVGLLSRYLDTAAGRYADWGRPFRDDLDFAALADDLAATTVVDETGKARLHWWRDGRTIQAGQASLIGLGYFFKLNHLSRDKMNARGDKGPLGLLTGQPVAGKKRSGGMKLGEMEMWCLRERPVPHVLQELYRRGDPGRLALKTLQDQLFVLGFQLQVGTGGAGYTFRFLGGAEQARAVRDFPPLSSHSLPRLATAEQRPALRMPRPEASLYDGRIFGEQARALFQPEGGKKAILEAPDQWGRIDLRVPLPHSLVRHAGLLPTEDEAVLTLPVLPVRHRGFLWDGRTPPRPGRLDALYAGIIRDNNRLRDDGREAHKALKAIARAVDELDPGRIFTTASGEERFLKSVRLLLFPQVRTTWHGDLQRSLAPLRTAHLDDEADWLEGLLRDSRRDLEPVRALSTGVGILFRLLISLLGGENTKKGLIRNHILGLRLNRSARAVIVPEPEMPLGTLGLPEAWRPILFPELADQAEAAGAVLLNRNPSLLPCSIQSFAVRFERGGTIRLNPGLCSSLGADFDGDQVSVFALSEPEAVREAQAWLRPGAMPFSPKEPRETVLLSDNLDIRLGSYCLARNRDGFAAAARLLGDRVAWEEDLGWEGRRQALEQALTDGLREASPEERERLGAAWLRLCFAAATESGMSFGFLDLLALHAGLGSTGRKAVRAVDAGEVAACNDTAEREVVDLLLACPDNPVSILFQSKAASKKEQLAQSLVRRGAIRLPHAPERAWLVDAGYVRGLRPAEFFAAAQATREAMMFKKLRTAAGGGFTRRLVECCQEFTLEDFLAEIPAFCAPDAVAPHEPFSRMRTPARALPLGLLAAHVIGEAATQASMKVFHTGKAGAAASIPEDLFNALPELAQVWEEISEPAGGSSASPLAKKDPELASQARRLRERIREQPLCCAAAQAMLRQGVRLKECGRFLNADHPLASLLYSLTRGKLTDLAGLAWDEPIPCNAKERFVLRLDTPPTTGESRKEQDHG